MDDYKIALGALLDANAKGDINKQLNAIKDLSVTISKATLSNDVINDIKRQLTQNGIDLKLVFGNVNQITNQAKQVGQQIGINIGQQINQSISSAIQKGTMKSSDGKKDLSKYIPNGKLLQNDVAKQALKDFQALGVGIVTVKEEMKNIDGKNLLNGFTINIKNAKGEVESLRYALTDIEGKTGKMFQYTGGSINDAGAIKQIKDIENAFTDYTAKLAQFKSTNTNILSGLMQPLADFESKLAGLKNGTVTIDEVKNAFKLLGTEASKITENFTGQLSKTDAAIRKLAQGDEIMDKLKASFKGLNNAPKEITKELNSVSKLLQNVKNIESTEGRTANWSAEYRKWSDEVDKLQAKLSVLQKQQANMTTPQVFKTSELRNADIPYMTKVSNTINKQMPELQKMLNAHNWKLTDAKGIEDTDGKIKSLTLTVRDAEGALKQFVMQRAKLDTGKNTPNGLMQVGDVKILETASQAQEKLAQSIEKANAKLAEQADKIQLSFANGDYEAKVESTIAKTQQWRDANGEARISTTSLSTALSNLDKAYLAITADGGNTVANQKALKQAESELSAEIKKVTNDVTKMNAEYAKSSKVESLHQKLTEFYDKNSATHKKWGTELKQMMDATASGAKVTNSELLRMELRYKQIGNEARQAGKLGLSFFDSIKEQAKKFTQWVSITSVVMEGIRIGKDMIQDVRELDDSLLELTKVSDLSASGLEKVTEQAYELGEKVARTGKEVIDATTEFKRAGFDMQQSMDMAESAMVMTNVAENITDTADAAGTLISVLKGFNMDASETMTIVDKINQVSNTSPIGFDNIAEGLERTAGTMAQSGNTIDQTIGLITAGYAQLRNVEKVSTGLVTLSARLRGVDEDGEVIDGLSAKLQEDFGKIGVAIEDADGSLRSIYEIAQDYSKVLPTLTDKQKQYYAELAAGKRQVTVWNAITQQFQDAENAVNQSLNSQNSALDENQKKLDSIGGHVKSFESSMEHLSSTVVESDLVKFFVDLGTTGVKAIDGIVNALGSLGTAAVIGGIVAGFKNVGQAKMWACLIYAYPC